MNMKIVAHKRIFKKYEIHEAVAFHVHLSLITCRREILFFRITQKTFYSIKNMHRRYGEREKLN